MSRMVYVNGELVPAGEAKISVFDRGFLFADAVYEVTAVLRGQLLEWPAHRARLQRSLAEIGIEPLAVLGDLEHIQRDLVARNGVTEGSVYLQVSRGAAEREFACPPGVSPSVVVFTHSKPVIDNPLAERGLKIISVPDIRWGRRDIKSVGLLAPVLAMHQAKAAGADDAWLVEDGVVTEGSNNSAYIVTSKGEVVTRELSHRILPGVTRAAVLALAREADIVLEERAFTLSEAIAASEAFITSATAFVLPVVEIDGKPIGDGRPGPLARRLRELYLEEALSRLE